MTDSGDITINTPKNMIQEHITIDNIPATLWGDKRNDLFIAIHGNLSHKEDMVIQILANEAICRGYQVLSFDLPEHGQRKGDDTPCKVHNCVQDLTTVMDYAKTRWVNFSLFACSMGAFFSLLAYRDVPLSQALFLSPVVDMERIISNMMNWFQVSPERLETEGTVDTPIGQKLYWDYYRYVKDHPVDRWDTDTSILYGSNDAICEFDTIRNFSDRFHCGLEIMEAGEHYFHTDDQLKTAIRWLQDNIA